MWFGFLGFFLQYHCGLQVTVVSFNFADISPERKGNGGESIYGPTFEGKKHINSPRHLQYYCEKALCMHGSFTACNMCPFCLLDESFAVSHTKRGILGMSNKGPHSNGSQFYITLQPTPWMDRTYVAFGFVSLISLERHLFNFPILHNLRSVTQFCWSRMSLFSILVKWSKVSTSSGD